MSEGRITFGNVLIPRRPLQQSCRIVGDNALRAKPSEEGEGRQPPADRRTRVPRFMKLGEISTQSTMIDLVGLQLRAFAPPQIVKHIRPIRTNRVRTTNLAPKQDDGSSARALHNPRDRRPTNRPRAPVKPHHVPLCSRATSLPWQSCARTAFFDYHTIIPPAARIHRKSSPRCIRIRR